MDFGALPPEINSGRMYAGPGPESLVSAAAAWDALAAELRAAAVAYTSAITGLTDESWQGPSATAMSAAAAPYAAWMNSTAAQAEQTAAQARSAAAAFETAFAAVVPPPVIVANRAQLASLVATNIFGQNTVAIAATEAQYGEMWAEDAAAMYGYAAQSASASQVTPFTAAPQTTNPGGLAVQAAAAGQTAGANTQTTLAQLIAGVPQALQSLAAPAQAELPSVAQISSYLEAIPKLLLPANDILLTVIYGLVQGVRAVQTGTGAAAAGSLAAGLASTTHVAGVTSLGAAGGAVSAGLGEAAAVGAMSVPPSWAAATPTIRLAASVLQSTSVGAAPAVVAEGSGGLFSQLALAGMAGSALGAAAPQAVAGGVGRVGRPLTDNKDKTDNTENKKSDKLERVLAEMSQKPESVQHWHTDETQLESLLAQLSKKPGIHAVHVSNKGKSTSRQPPPI
ncbi:PPE family protein [Mycobacterium shimoidei]|uniref:PPE family protein n=1 Tax=Mycobacterium shimoidei TaxID=29313 RepID=UPI0008485913|nr:PPE family protein [Mycobacterium shimoidei]MCV7259021.1 PPE family protein [Mycobacterium shimoidei]ODR10784.1 hypothetical protein BHQ16_18890 [Mycobacterium shimoidei]ORW83242.1 hypothetical protein AWC26_02135 [Mycobacterium shimoidei]